VTFDPHVVFESLGWIAGYLIYRAQRSAHGDIIDEKARRWVTISALAGGLIGIQPNVASALRGFYGEAAYRVWAQGPARDLVTFVRYENFDTQFRMPAGYTPLKEFDRDAWVLGATYYPDPDIAVKIDYIWQRSVSSVIEAPNSLNIGLGWWF